MGSVCKRYFNIWRNWYLFGDYKLNKRVFLFCFAGHQSYSKRNMCWASKALNTINQRNRNSPNDICRSQLNFNDKKLLNYPLDRKMNEKSLDTVLQKCKQELKFFNTNRTPGISHFTMWDTNKAYTRGFLIKLAAN